MGATVLRIIIFFLAITFSHFAKAEDVNIYDTEVTIDAVAASSAEAREKAMSEANRKALYAVTNRISSSSSTDILDNLNDNQILNFIKEVSVISEKVSDSRYIATLKISINAQVLKTYLAEKNAPVTIMPRNHIVIVPVYREKIGFTPLLWEDNNLWYDTWQSNTTKTGQITISPATKNPINQSILTVNDAISLNIENLGKILRNENGNEIYIAEITSDSEQISTELKSPRIGIISTKSYQGKTPELFETIINDMKLSIIQQIQQQTLATENQQKQMTVIFSYTHLKEWLYLQTTLKNITPIKKITTNAMGKNKVQFSIDYIGNTNFLAQNKLFLADKGDFYTIERNSYANNEKH